MILAQAASGCLVGQQPARGGIRVLMWWCWPLCAVTWPTPTHQPLISRCNATSPAFLDFHSGFCLITNIQCFPDNGKGLDQLSDGVVGTTPAMFLLLILGDKGTCLFKEISGGKYHLSKIEVSLVFCDVCQPCPKMGPL